MMIQEQQEAIVALGWQYLEQVFNDGSQRNCLVRFTQDKSPSALMTYPAPEDVVGWGRFTRAWAWQQAYDYIVGGVRRG